MDTLHEILQAVANGELDPQQASERIAALPPSAQDAGAALERQPVQRVVVRATGVRLTVLGDPAVAEAVAEGHHRMDRDGASLVVSTNPAEGMYSTQPQESSFLNWLTSIVVGQKLVVRVNPGLPVQVQLVGGSLDLRGLRAGATVTVEAGAAKLEEGTGPVDVNVLSGSASLDWVFTGENTVRVDMGSANVVVRPESDVAITAQATLGQAVVKTDEGLYKAVGESTATAPVTVGAGSGALHAVARMGSVTLTVLA